MNHLGQHRIADLYNVPTALCLDATLVARLLMTAAEKMGMNVIGLRSVRLGQGKDKGKTPPGYACVVVVDESHLSAHSYADKQVVFLDAFTCGNKKMDQGWEWLLRQFRTINCREQRFNRGIISRTERP